MTLVGKIPALVFAILFIPAICIAQNCEVGVRVIKGSEKEGKSTDLNSLGKSLVSMEPQLKKLPYKKYDEMTSRRQQVALGKESRFSVSDAMGKPQTVKVQPVSVSEKRVEVLVNWLGADSSKLLSTKVRVLNGESVMLGTDSSGKHSTILSIKVSCPS